MGGYVLHLTTLARSLARSAKIKDGEAAPVDRSKDLTTTAYPARQGCLELEGKTGALLRWRRQRYHWSQFVGACSIWLNPATLFDLGKFNSFV